MQMKKPNKKGRMGSISASQSSARIVARKKRWRQPRTEQKLVSTEIGGCWPSIMGYEVSGLEAAPIGE
jgi:hypothetical protein